MSITTFLQQRGLPLEYAIYENWPKVQVEAIDKKKRARFLALRESIKLYCKDPISLYAVSKQTKVSESSLAYYFRRALEFDDEGRIYGERAFVPFMVRKGYEAHSDDNKGLAGKFKRVLTKHPILKDVVLKCVKKGESLELTHSAFKQALYELGFTDDDYPLDSDSQGEWSVKKLRKDLQKEHFRAAALAEGGEDAARNADVSQALQHLFNVTRPYQRIELDAHLLKAFFTIDIEELDGTVRTAVLKRLYIIVAIDTWSRAILGYHISLNAQPTIEDVATCLAHVLDPELRDQSEILGYISKQGMGLPDEVVSRTRFRAFTELALDNALAHTSPALHANLIGYICSTINLGKSRHPQGRPLIEGWFKLLKKFLADPLPSATGSNPKDPKRRKPRSKAKHYQISLHDLEILLESVIREYNHQHPESTTGQSPIEKLKRFLLRSVGLTRRLRPGDRGLDFLYQRFYTATIAGSVKDGKRPYVQFKTATYRNEQLSAMGPLIGKQVTLKVDIRDLRCIEAFLPSGEPIGKLLATGGWARTPHSLQTRQAIVRHRNRARVRNTIGDHVAAFARDIASATKRNANTPNVLTRLNQEVRRGLARDAERGNAPPATPQRDPAGRVWLDIGSGTDLEGEDSWN